MSNTEFYDGIQTAEKQARRSHRLLISLIIVLSMAVAAGAFYVFRQIEHQMSLHAAAVSDNRTWVIAQLEVDLAKFSLAMSEAVLSGDPADHLETVREQFDILYSRVLLLRSSNSLRQTGLETRAEWLLLSGGDGLLEQYIPVIDGPDEGLAAALPEMITRFADIRPGLRTGVVEAVFSIMGNGDLLRANLRDTLRMFAAATLWLLSGMAVLTLGLFLQSRSRTKHARALEFALQNLRTTINSALDAVLIVNGQGRVIGSNRATVSMFGGKLETARPRLSEILREGDDGSPSVSLTTLRPGMRFRIQGVRLNGTSFPVEASVGTGRTVSGRAITVIFVRDISEQIAHEERFAQARNAAMEADEAKARFLAVMSHEMRTPLTGLLSALDLLVRTTDLDDTQVWLSDIIRTCGTTALEQVNNVLHLSRMGSADAGQYPVSTFSLTQTLRDLVRQFQPDAARNETSVEFVGAENDVLGVSLPLQLLNRAVANLLSNAVKFTEKGQIRLELSHWPAEREGWVAIQIAVQDTGIGIAEKDLERIFENFETLDASYSRVREGSGLGLGIAKLAVGELGGHIETQSELGKGSRFTLFFEAPLAEVEVAEPAPRALPAVPLAELSVLLAEDNAINRTLITRQLEGLGAIVTTAEDGQHAFDKAAEKCFDLILMDVSMPRLDGLSATRLIRQKGACRNVPIIAITAQAAPERQAEYLAAGMTDVLMKPVRIDRLVEVMCQHARRPDKVLRDGHCKDAGIKTDMPLADDSMVESLLEDLGVDFVAKTVETFRLETDKALVLTRAALAERDMEQVRKLAHSSAGAAGALGLMALNRVLLDQENLAIAQDERKATMIQAYVEELYAQSMRHLGEIISKAKASALIPEEASIG
ncbi:response regulator [Pseudotabrizicola algicola]|uniref:histidine kinase n=1 Tax=Pseudotabrizicola algicola TaxID=2709381 RepID=A0A6B3RJE7_9RHOB|nr:response regulator [Pseudotabrizicola algicola]NEX45243.1 response regulator [Pseudotabrizicola algicola]